MYGSQIWGTQYLRSDCAAHMLSGRLQGEYMAYFRGLVRCRPTVSKVALLHELAQTPLQFYWLRSLLRFHNGLPDTRSELIFRVAAADVALEGSRCWSEELRTGLRRLDRTWWPAGDNWPTHQQRVALSTERHVQLPIKTMLDTWQSLWASKWARLENDDPRDPNVAHREAVTYAAWFQPEGVGMEWKDLPAHLLPPKPPNGPRPQQHMRLHDGVRQWRAVTKFRLCDTTLACDAQRRQRRHGNERIPWGERNCTYCWHQHATRAVEDAQHVVFECPAYSDLRKDIDEELAAELRSGNLLTFMRAEGADTFVATLMCEREKRQIADEMAPD
jgi:hypothetical protein